MELIPGVAALALRYDGFILDLWGVVHDGTAPFPGVLDCMGRLIAAGKRVVLLSNARLTVTALPVELARHVEETPEISG